MQPWINGAEIDREVAESDPCPECGGHMSYRAERGLDEYEEPYYRAFAVCDNKECEQEDIEF